MPVIKAKLDKDRDAGFYIDENDTDTKYLSGTLTMDTKKGLLSNTYLSFTSHERWLGAEAFKYAGDKWVDGTTLIFQTVGKLFIGQGWGSVGGPLAILTQSTTIFRNNPFSVYIQMWGLISVNLAVMNLLPIPGLDGWHILVTLTESVIRRKLPPAFKKWASRIGLIFVFGLMIVVLGLDILRIFGIAL
jgi:RIP metalloprotease RseP